MSRWFLSIIFLIAINVNVQNCFDSINEGDSFEYDNETGEALIFDGNTGIFKCGFVDKSWKEVFND